MTALFEMTIMRRFFTIAAGVVLAAACMEPAWAVGPSFDCGKAESAVEKLICSHGQLAELDHEMARLFDLARTGAHVTPAERDVLLASQREWLRKRENCGTADDPRRCVATALIARIVDLRQTYPDVRQHDQSGISLGPFVARCTGFDGKIDVSYVNSSPAFAYVTEPNGSLVLKQAMSGSGARYDATFPAGRAEVWTKGNGAQITLPGRPEMTCMLDALK